MYFIFFKSSQVAGFQVQAGSEDVYQPLSADIYISLYNIRIFPSLAPSANYLQINQRILSRQKSNGMNVITSGGRSLTQQICLYVGGGRYIFN